MGNDIALIEGLLDKWGAAEAEAVQLRASLASVQTRLKAEQALADELAEMLRRCMDTLAIEEIPSQRETSGQWRQAEESLARWADARRNPQSSQPASVRSGRTIEEIAAEER